MILGSLAACTCLGVWWSGFRVYSFRVCGLGFRLQGLGIGVYGLVILVFLAGCTRFKVWGYGFRFMILVLWGSNLDSTSIFRGVGFEDSGFK